MQNISFDKKIKIALIVLTSLIVIIAITKYRDHINSNKSAIEDNKKEVQTETNIPEQSIDPLANEKNKKALAEINRSLTEGYKAKEVIEVDKDAQEVVYSNESGSTGVLEIGSLAKLNKQFWKDNFDIEVIENTDEESYKATDNPVESDKD